MSLATNLKFYRLNRRYSFYRLSELSGISQASLKKIENGTSSPKVDTLLKLASGLDIPPSDLLRQNDFEEIEPSLLVAEISSLTLEQKKFIRTAIRLIKNSP